MRNKKLIILLFAFWSLASGIAQNNAKVEIDSFKTDILSHAVTSRAVKDKVILRWAPTDIVYWDMGNNYGYKIEKIALKADPFLTTSKFTKEELKWKNITPGNIKPWTTEQFKAGLKNTSNQYLAIAAEMLYGEIYGKKDVTKGENMLASLNEQQNKHGYAMMSADLNSEAAKSLGLRYEDSDVKDGMFYLYRVIIDHNDPEFPADTAEVFIDFSKKYTAKAVSNLWQEAGDSELMIAWTRSNQNNFSAYDIEKSEDGKTWKKLNKRPYLSSFDKNEKAFIYIDSMVVNKKTYSYRLRGYTPFGDMGLYSEVLTSTPKDLTPPTPVYAVKAEDMGGAVKITWEASPTEEDFDGFYVARSENAAGGFKKISKKLDKKERVFVDFQANPLENNYYTIYCADKSGNESMSYVALGYIVDSLPPTPPMGMKGNIDTNGVVSISWNKGPEADLIGYRVYWANDTLSEFSQLTGEVIPVTNYRDSVNIRTLSEYAYYRIVAVDHRYNHSEFSKTIRLQKPDLVPPARPVISKYEQGQLEVKLQWVNSISKDVVDHRMERKIQGEDWKPLETFNKKEKEIKDKNLSAGKKYSYRIIATDDAGNKSISNEIMITAIDRARKVNVENFKLIESNGSAQLEWNYKGSGEFSFVIYKQNDEKSFEPVGRINNSEKTYKNVDAKGVYGIKAVYRDGGESSMAITK